MNRSRNRPLPQITYDYLVVAMGLDLRFDLVEGLPETLGKNGVCSNYGPGNADYTWKTLSGTSINRS